MVYFKEKCGDCIIDLVNFKSKCIRLFFNFIFIFYIEEIIF